MKERFLRYLCCPLCGGDFDLEVDERAEQEILAVAQVRQTLMIFRMYGI